MTCVIRDVQLDTLAGRRFEDGLVAHFFEHFAPHCNWLGNSRVTEVVRLGVAKAKAYGHESERQVCLFISVMFMLGTHFDEDPQLPWVARTLRAEGWEPLRRVEALYQDTMYFIDDVAGENNEHLVRALVRFRKLDREAGLQLRGDQIEPGITKVLASVYPEKVAVLG